ncbi:MAG: response regulator [Pseudobacteriovorax sp.]|nr:response regulator [Pseudobacteriovorax sp.]
MNYLIIDDEAAARKRLLRLMKHYPQLSCIGEAEDGITGLKLIHNKNPDVVFLDIDMPGLTGIEIAQSLSEDGPAIVFVTAYDQYAVQAFEANSVDYLVKPIAQDRLKGTIERLTKGLASKLPDPPTFPLDRLAFRSEGNYQVLDLSDISLISATQDYQTVYVKDKKILVDESLDSLEKRLPEKEFIRVHRSAIINLTFLGSLERLGDRKYQAVLTDHWANEVAIARDRLGQIKSRLGL